LNRFRNPNRFILILGFVLILSSLIVACSGSTTQQTEAEIKTESEIEEDYQVVLPAVGKNDKSEAGQAYPDPEIDTGGGVASASNEAYPEPEEPTAALAPIVRTELEATDPSTVSLASGELQLVEFFAFW
jgi:hypothetical protein